MARLDRVDAWMVVLVLVWGTAFVAIKELLVVLDPYQLTWFRYVPFLGLFGVWLVARRWHKLRTVTLREWLRYLLLGMVGVAGYHFPLNWGLGPDSPGAEVTAATGAILVATTPLWALLFTAIGGQERFNARKTVWSGVAFAGVAVVVMRGGGPDTEWRFAWKALVILLAPMFWSLYSVLGKPLVHRHGPLFFTGLTMCLGTAVLLPYGIAQGAAPLRGLTGLEWVWLVYLSLAATVAGYAVWNLSLKRRTATEITSYIYLVPVVATAAGWLLLDEAITFWFAAGSVLVLWGVIQVNRARVQPSPVAAAAALLVESRHGADAGEATGHVLPGGTHDKGSGADGAPPRPPSQNP